MDPLEINSSLNDLIFQHFDLNEILEISKVSKSWNKKIAESHACMRKIKFSLKLWKTFDKQRQIDERIEILKSENLRNYQNFSIDCQLNKSFSEEFWKVLKFFLRFSLVSLKIKGIKLECPEAVEIPKLEELKLVYVPINVSLIRTVCPNGI